MLHTATAPAHEPAPAPVHFKLYIEHFALHATHLYCMLHIYHFTLKHGKMNLNVVLSLFICFTFPQIDLVDILLGSTSTQKRRKRKK